VVRRHEILKTAATRTFDLPDPWTLIRPVALASGTPGNAGDFLLQTLNLTYTEPGVKADFDRLQQMQDRSAAAPLFRSKAMAALQQAVQRNACSLTIDKLPVKTLLDTKTSLELPAQLLAGWDDILALEGDSYAQAGQRNYQKAYYQAALTLGGQLTEDVSPVMQMTGLNLIVANLKRLNTYAQAAGDAALPGQLQQIFQRLGGAYTKTTLEEILVLAGDTDGMKALEGWMKQPDFARSYGCWTILAGLTQWSPEEYRFTGPGDSRRAFLEDMSRLQDARLAKVGQLARADLDSLAQKWATLGSVERAGFGESLLNRPVALANPLVQALWNAPLEPVPAAVAQK
jgi:hypothetical protein